MLAIMLCALALLQTLEHPMIAGGGAELTAAFGDVRLVLGQFTHPVDPLCLDLFDEGLTRGELLGAEDGRLGGGVALFGTGVLEMHVDGLEAVLTTAQTRGCLSELLTGEILAALTQGADALESEPEGGSCVHVRVIGHTV